VYVHNYIGAELTSSKKVDAIDLYLFQENCCLWDKENIEAFSKGDSLIIIMRTFSADANDTAEVSSISFTANGCNSVSLLQNVYV